VTGHHKDTPARQPLTHKVTNTASELQQSAQTDGAPDVQISAVIPTFNRWPTVARAIESVLAQSVQPTQILVVDDGSQDNTATHLSKRFGRQIDVLTQANLGVSAARNHALVKAEGNWIALLDSDDEWLPEKLQKQTLAITNNTDAVLVHSDEIWVRHGTRVNSAKKHQKRGGFIYQHCLPLCCISPSAAMIKTSVLRDLGGFDETLPACEDYDLWLRLCARHPVVYIDEPLLIKYGGHDDQLSHQHWGMDRFRITALEKVLRTETLSCKLRALTVQTLVKKATILRNGAIKRNNVEMINRCEKLIARYGTRQNTP
jgi:glycosyltransferase involved in cell wall biosynthesis